MFISITETEEIIEGPKVVFFPRGDNHIHEGRIITKIRKPKLYGVSLGQEINHFAVSNENGVEYVTNNIPKEMLENNGMRFDVSDYVTKEYSPLFPKIIVLLAYLCMIIPVLPFLIRLVLIGDVRYLKGMWLQLCRLIIPVATIIHLLFWPYVFWE